MLTYFKPLRRKIGVMTLGLACVLAAGWIRSHRVQDTFVIDFGTGTSVELLSACKSLIFVSANVMKQGSPLKMGFRLDSYVTANDELYFPLDEPNAITSSKSDPFKSHSVKLTAGPVYNFEAFQLPYWSIVIPLTLLSAWLLLSRPRAPKPVPPAAENAR